MTINIALATYDGIILGCDSLSSIVDHAIFPFRGACETAKDAEGNELLDADGFPLIPAYGPHLTQVATTVFSGVNKVFPIYLDDDTTVAALTSGMATLLDVTIAEQAKRYRRKNDLEQRKFTSVDDVAEDFKMYMRDLWLQQFGTTPEDQRHFLPTLHFLLAGFGLDDTYGKVFKIEVALDQVVEQFPDGNHMGLSWAGQADYVERVIRGIDRQLEMTATREMIDAISRQRETTIADISVSLENAGVQLPEGLTVDVIERTAPTLPWESARADIDYGNLSTQYAVELVELLVNTQSGMQRFARGIATVGGRTHIGVLKRGERLNLLNAPELLHRHTGYGDGF